MCGLAAAASCGAVPAGAATAHRMASAACEAVYLPVLPLVAAVQQFVANSRYLLTRQELPLIGCTPPSALRQLLQPDPSCCSHKFTSGQPPRCRPCCALLQEWT